MGLGALLLAGGALLIEGLRHALLVRETLPPSTVPSLAVYGRDYHLTLGQNLHELGAALQFRFATGYPILVPAFLVAALALAVQLVRVERDRHAALSLVIVLMIGSFVCFGDLYESRILLPLVPFVAMHGWQALNPVRPTSRPERIA